LLQDGRILVSSSDPRRRSVVQEYPVQVFIRLYLMGNTTKPSYLLNNNETSYGQGNTITITMLRDSAAKVSFVGAMSCTHGNSMG